MSDSVLSRIFALINTKNDAPGQLPLSFRAHVFIGVAAAFHAAFTLHMTESSVERVGGGNRPVAVPPQWLPVFASSIIIDHDETLAYEADASSIRSSWPWWRPKAARLGWRVLRHSSTKSETIRCFAVASSDAEEAESAIDA